MSFTASRQRPTMPRIRPSSAWSLALRPPGAQTKAPAALRFELRMHSSTTLRNASATDRSIECRIHCFSNVTLCTSQAVSKFTQPGFPE